jgi:hypothetical protein
MDLQTLITIAASTTGVIVWLVRMEGRINKNDASIADVKEDIRYIRARIDRALNGHHDD